MKTKFETIKSYNCAFGGESWRAISNGEQVHIQSQSATSNSWVTQRRMTVEAFEEYADEVGMYDAYNENPAHLSHLADEEA